NPPMGAIGTDANGDQNFRVPSLPSPGRATSLIEGGSQRQVISPVPNCGGSFFGGRGLVGVDRAAAPPRRFEDFIPSGFGVGGGRGGGGGSGIGMGIGPGGAVGGGDPGPEFADFPTPRVDFRSTAFFVTSVVTDDSGRAVIRAPLPDGLTSYRVMAVAS